MRSGDFASTKEPVIQVHPGDIAVIAVAPGEGLARVLRDLGVAAVIHGGETMNPSTEDFLNAIKSLENDKFIIFAHNKNIILASGQGAQVANENGSRRVVGV